MDWIAIAAVVQALSAAAIVGLTGVLVWATWNYASDTRKSLKLLEKDFQMRMAVEVEAHLENRWEPMGANTTHLVVGNLSPERTIHVVKLEIVLDWPDSEKKHEHEVNLTVSPKGVVSHSIEDFLRGHGQVRWDNMAMRIIYETAGDDIIRKTQTRCYQLHFFAGSTTFLELFDCEKRQEILEAARQSVPD